MKNIQRSLKEKNTKENTLKTVRKMPVSLNCIATMWVLILLLPGHILAQNSASFGPSPMMQVVAARNLEVSCNRTCMLIFPAAIQSADRGAAYVLATRVPGSENVLKVKAGRSGFNPSSLTVITKDGQVYAFNVSYKARPPYLVLDFRLEKENNRKPIGNGRCKEQQEQQPYAQFRNNPKADYLQNVGSGSVHFSGIPLNYAEVHQCMESIKLKPAFIKGVHKNRFGIELKLEGVYFHKEVLFFKFGLHNKDGIPFKFESLRLFIRDNKMARRTAVQDQELETLAKKSWGLPEQVNTSGNTTGNGQQIVVAVPRFTIADGKRLAVTLREEAGDRHLTLKVKERVLRKTRTINTK